jgi:hypothetical protein
MKRLFVLLGEATTFRAAGQEEEIAGFVPW